MLNAKVEILGPGQRSAAASCAPVFLFLGLLFLNALGFRFPSSGFRFQRFSFFLHAQVTESSSVKARSLLLGVSMAYSTRGHLNSVRWI